MFINFLEGSGLRINIRLDLGTDLVPGSIFLLFQYWEIGRLGIKYELKELQLKVYDMFWGNLLAEVWTLWVLSSLYLSFIHYASYLLALYVFVSYLYDEKTRADKDLFSNTQLYRNYNFFLYKAQIVKKWFPSVNWQRSARLIFQTLNIWT